MIILYQTLALKFMQVIYRYHRLAFQTHFKSIMGLFLATWLTLAVLWLI